MHPFLNWLLTHHRDHRCLTAVPQRWAVECQIQWPQDPTFHILDCDRCPDFLQGQSQGRKRPDFLLFLERKNRVLVLILELTRGAVEPDKRDQIAEGLRTLEGYLAQPGDEPHLFRSVDVHAWILHSGHVRNEDMRRLQQPLALGGRPLRPVVDRCGRLLRDLLAHWPQKS
jgi:hypothetical protein